MKTNREVLASLLTGNSEPLQQYKREREACFILLIERKRETGYCIYPDLTVKEVETNFIRSKMEKSEAFFKVLFTDSKITFEEFEADLLANPSKYYKAEGLRQMVFFANA